MPDALSAALDAYDRKRDFDRTAEALGAVNSAQTWTVRRILDEGVPAGGDATLPPQRLPANRRR